MVGVVQHGIRDALGQLPELLDVLVDGDRDDLEVGVPLGVEFVLQCLPPGQLVAAASPTGEGDQQPLLAAVIAEGGDAVAVHVRQREVRSLEIGERLAADRTRRADRGDAAVGVDRHRAIEQPAEHGEVDPVVADECSPVGNEHARVVLTEAFGFERPAQIGEL